MTVLAVNVLGELTFVRLVPALANAEILPDAAGGGGEPPPPPEAAVLLLLPPPPPPPKPLMQSRARKNAQKTPSKVFDPTMVVFDMMCGPLNLLLAKTCRNVP